MPIDYGSHNIVTSGSLDSKIVDIGNPVWSTGGSPITSDRREHAGTGTIDAGLITGGGNPPTNKTEEYDGATWSLGGDLITNRYGNDGAGTQNASFVSGGFDSSNNVINTTEEYDGASWSAGGNLGTARRMHASAGTLDAGLTFGGVNALNSTEEYNGTSWSTGGNLITGRYSLAGFGSQNAGLSAGGSVGAADNNATEEYDGTSWSTGGNLLTGTTHTRGAGTQDVGFIFGGAVNYSTPINSTAKYDGTSWSASDNMITARRFHSGAGLQNAALATAGFAVNSTEQYEGIAPTSGSRGEFRFNVKTLSFEGYDGTQWETLNGLVSNPSLVPNSIALTNVVVISQADYDALGSYSDTTLYVITD